MGFSPYKEFKPMSSPTLLVSWYVTARVIFVFQGFIIYPRNTNAFSIPLYHFHPFTNILTIFYSFSIWDNYLLFSIAVVLVSRLFLDQIYLSLEIRIWLTINFVLLVGFLSDFVISISHRQALGMNLHQLSSYHYKMKWLTKWAI